LLDEGGVSCCNRATSRLEWKARHYDLTMVKLME
jgi:hypothetical protein